MHVRPLLADNTTLALTVAVLLGVGGLTTISLIAVSAVAFFYFVVRLALPLDPRRQQRPRRPE
jgi:hypothetical protein